MPPEPTRRPSDPVGRPAGVIFDMDGLLLDSERLAMEAFVRACTDHGWRADLDVYVRCIGSTYETTARILKDHYGPDFPYEAVDASWSSHYHARLAQAPVPVKPGALDLLEYLKAADVPLALATSTRRSTAEGKLRSAGLIEYFRHSVCGGETARGKPYPDPYVAAASGLGLEPGQCLALEDSENGVRSAHAAGCLVIQVPDLVAPGPELEALGHRIFASLSEVVTLLTPDR